jgi:hypothetical protein
MPKQITYSEWSNTCLIPPCAGHQVSVQYINVLNRRVCFAGWAGPTRELNTRYKHVPSEHPNLPHANEVQPAHASQHECEADEQQMECSKGPAKDYEQSMEDRLLKGNGNQAFAETVTERQALEAEPEVVSMARIRPLRQKDSPVTHVVLFDVQEAAVRDILQRLGFVRRTQLFHAIAGAELDATAVVVWERGLHSN